VHRLGLVERAAEHAVERSQPDALRDEALGAQAGPAAARRVVVVRHGARTGRFDRRGCGDALASEARDVLQP